MAPSNPQEHQDKFTEEQLRAVNAICRESTDSVDFAKAKEIGLITDETRAKIEKALGPEHDGILKSVRDRILRNDETIVGKAEAPSEKRRAALKLAFEKVYGKFLFEQEYRGPGVSDSTRQFNEKLEKKLSEVLKVEIDGKTGITGRSELIAARRRLMSANDPENILDEAFKTGKKLTPEDKNTLVGESIAALSNLAANPFGKESTVYDAEFTSAKTLVVQPYDKEMLEKAVNTFETLRAFLTPPARKIVDEVIGKLEQIIGIPGKLEIQRADTNLKEAEGKLAKTKELQTYFETDQTSNIESPIEELLKQTKNAEGNPKTFADPEREKDEDTTLKYYDVGLKENIEALTSLKKSLEGTKTNNMKPDDKLAHDKKILSTGKTLSALIDLNNAAKAARNSFLLFASNAVFLVENGFLHPKFKLDDITAIETKLRGLNPETSSVSVEDLDKIYGDLKNGDWFKLFQGGLKSSFAKKTVEFEKDVARAKSEKIKLEEEYQSVTDLSDTAAAKKIILAVVKKQHPGFSLEEQYNLADLILAEDIEKIQTQKSYEELAKEGSEDLEELVRNASEHDFRWKILKFRYQVDGKLFEPFKGLNPEDLTVWAKVEKQFTAAGKFDYQSGFYFLAAIKEFFGENIGSFTIVHKNLEKKLKALIVERLGVSKRMGESYIRRLVDDTFEKQLKDSRELMVAHFDNYNKNRSDISKAKIKELKHKLTELQENRKLGKIDQERYEEKYEDIMEEARDYGIDNEVSFIQDAELSGYLNSPEAQWIKDLGVDIGRYAKDKAWALTKGTAKTGLNAAVGTVKAGTSLAFQGALTPLRLLKYPAFIAIKPIAGFINLFRTNKLNTPQIMATARQDISRVGNYLKTIGTESFEGAKTKTAEAYSKPWSEAQFKRVKYADRTKVKLDDESSRIKELGEKSDLKPIEIASAPAIDFDAIRAKIEESDKLSGSKAGLEKGATGEVKNKGAVPEKKGPESNSETAAAA